MTLNALLLVIFITWLSLEAFWLPSVHNRLDTAIKGRIKMSDVIASMNLNEKKFPGVVSHIQNNFDVNNTSAAEIQSGITALISSAARETGVKLKSLKYPGNRTKSRVMEFVSILEISGSFAALQSFLTLLENDTRIIRIDALELTTGDPVLTFRAPAFVQYSLKINLHLSKIKLF